MSRATVVLALVGVLASLSCFSERDGVTDNNNGAGDCRVPVSALGTNKQIVMVQGFRFLPDTVRLRPGGTVTWVNCEPSNIEAHTATSTTNVWDTGLFGPGESRSQQFPARGTFNYFCQPHPSMRGVIIVE